MAKRSVDRLALCVGLSLGLAACSASSGKPTDAAIEHAMDAPAADRTETKIVSDAHDSSSEPPILVDARDGGDTAKADSGAGGSSTGGTGAGGTGMGGLGMGGTGTGGTGVGGMGVGGMTTGTGGAATDAGPDIAAGGSDGGSADAPADVPSPTDGPGDTAPACGAGCPANVDPQDLVLWISADVGLTCDQGTTPRVTGWKDRRAGSTVMLTPVSGKFGPRCDGQTLNGTPLPYFDRTTTDINNGILRIDLTPLNGQDYTVFVVERRRTADARFILGTDVPVPAISKCVDDTTLVNPNAHLAYRFGYQVDTIFESGSYTYDPDTGNCDDPAVLVPAFSTPQAALEIDFLSSGDTHTLTAAGTTNPSVVDTNPMDMLLQGYLGRANQLPSTSDSRYLGEVAEVVIYKAALTPDQVTAVSNYLKGRWNL